MILPGLAFASVLALISYVSSQSTIISTVVIPPPIITSTITITLITLTLTPTPTSSTTVFVTISGVPPPPLTSSSTSTLTSTKVITVTATQTVRPPSAAEIQACPRPMRAQCGGVGYAGACSECITGAQCLAAGSVGPLYMRCMTPPTVEVFTEMVYAGF